MYGIFKTRWLKSAYSPKQFFKNNADLDVKGNPDRFKCLKSCNRIVAFKYKFVIFR